MRVTINLPPESIKIADDAAKKLCLSRSAFIALAISEKVQNDSLIRSIPEMLDELRALQAALPSESDSETES